VATAELDGRPVVISGGDDETAQVWDLATRKRVGHDSRVHTDDVNAVAVAELCGRLVFLSGSYDRTIWIWDLATGAPVGDPFTSKVGPVQSLVSLTAHAMMPTDAHAHVGFGANYAVVISSITPMRGKALQWNEIAALEVNSKVLAVAWPHSRALVVGTELGIVAFDLPGH
jgi:WD40 repeat protein